MKSISGFSFVHDALTGGYPIAEAIRAVQPYVDEVVVVDMASTDGTRELLERLGVRIVDGRWGSEAGETLKAAHALHCHCKGDVIIHFEADEVYSDKLLKRIRGLIWEGVTDISVCRLQLEQNFQRCRWYPEPVHRVFPCLLPITTIKAGHTTNRHDLAQVIPVEAGLLWDITNCFRDNWIRRVENQAQLWNEEPKYRMVPLHMLHKVEIDKWQAQLRLSEAHWIWKETPFDIPAILRPLVGMTEYAPTV
ncbi:MAG: glycosyltransferase [Planctomycetota bacterium]